MIMKDLIDKLNKILAEGTVNPGDKKAISFRIKKLEKFREKLDDYRRSLRSIQNTNMPAALQSEKESLSSKMEEFISQVEKELLDLEIKYEDNGEIPIKLNKLFQGIEKNCSQIVKIYKQINNENLSTNRFIFRGIRSNEDALYSLPHTTRRPKDSRENVDKLADAALKNNGFIAARANSVFTTGNYSQASGYGHSVYVIFPFDGFHFTYSKTIGDLILRDEYLSYFVNDEVKDKILALLEKAYNEAEANSPMKSKFDGIEDIRKLFTRQSYGGEDKNTIVNLTMNERFNERHELATLFNDLYTDDTKFMEHMQFVNDDVYSAITSQHEIYLNSKFYAIKYEYIDKIKTLLQRADVSETELPERFGNPPEIIYGPGDIIEFVKGEHEGKLGVITDANKLTLLDISTTYNGNPMYQVPASDVKLYDDPKKFDFKEGDKVIMTTEGSAMFGHSAEVTEVFKNSGTLKAKFEVGISGRFYNIQMVKETPETQEFYADKKTELLNVGEKVVVTDESNVYYQFAGEVNGYSSSGKVDVVFREMNVAKTLELSQITKTSDYTGKIKAPIARHSTVKVISGKFKGKIGTVMSIYNDGDLSIRFSDNSSELIPINKVKSTITVPDIPENLAYGAQVKVGDLVKVTDSVSSFDGNKGIVLLIDPDNFSGVAAKVVRPDKSEFWTMVSSLTKLKVPDKNNKTINIGDAVKTSTKEGVVKNFGYSSDGNVLVNFTDGDTDYKILTHKLVVVDSSKLLKVGDTVKVVSSSSSLNDEIGKVVSIKNSKEVEVKIDSITDPLVFTKSELSPADETTTDNANSDLFSPGDRFVISDDHPSSPGIKGTIIHRSYSDEDGPRVILDGRGQYPKNIVSKFIIKINEPEKTFKIGDIVSVKKPNNPVKFNGKISNMIDGDGEFRMEFPDGDSMYATPDQMRKSDSINPEQFEIGDYAKVVSSPYGYEGMVGEVGNVSDDKQTIELTFPTGEVQQFDTDDLVKNDPPEEDADDVNEQPIDVKDTVVVTKGEHTGLSGTVNYIWTAGEIDITITSDQEIQVPDASYLKKTSASKGAPGLDDSVKIKTGHASGKIGKVIAVDKDSVTVDVDGDNLEYTFNEVEKIDKTLKVGSNKEPASKEPASKEPASDELKVGDKIKVVKTDAAGKTGVITNITNSNTWPYHVVYDDDPNSTPIFNKDEIELISDTSSKESEIAVGDKVEIADGGYSGYPGIITKIVPNALFPYTVSFKDENGEHTTGVYELDELTIFPKTSQANTDSTKKDEEPKFKLGDMVTDEDEEEPGEIIAITPGTAFLYTVSFNGGAYTAVYSEEELTLVPETPSEPVAEPVASATTFNQNDLVYINGINYVPDNTLGKVTVAGETSSEVKILEGTSMSTIYNIPNDKLTKVPPYKEGDTVLVINDRLDAYGKEGVIQHINGNLLSITTGFGPAVVQQTSVKKVEQSEQVQVALTEPEFKPGDSVEIIDPLSQYNGNKGMLIYAGHQYVDAVFTSDQSQTYTFGKSQIKKLPYNIHLPDPVEFGDEVKIIHPSHEHYLETFTVTDTSEDGTHAFLESLKDNSTTSASILHLKKIS